MRVTPWSGPGRTLKRNPPELHTWLLVSQPANSIRIVGGIDRHSYEVGLFRHCAARWAIRRFVPNPVLYVGDGIRLADHLPPEEIPALQFETNPSDTSYRA